MFFSGFFPCGLENRAQVDQISWQEPPITARQKERKDK